ncbi:threonine synthase [Haloarchaeobius iranensis]|uniref:Threonine synthase n=1 Tax=Haloarchaeobius iranensis TaxID=996166 RepID=A0A1G9SGN7_9EURY|nr:threonine synthase [Haloarchaeobius iranensis]SDM34562.1 L-threonine synthase [Haloarchaeobius iranensis]
MTLDHVETLECTRCGATFDPERVVYTCPNHEGVAGILEVVYDYDVVDDRFDAALDGDIPNQWKYRAFLPVDTDAEPVTLDEGGTDLLDAPRLGDELGVDLRVKNDGLNPTGCFKDRATSIAATKARFGGQDVVTCASTGNAAASLAGYAARAGLDCRIFVPAAAPEGKLVQPRVYGADVLAVDGSYDEAYDLSLEVTDAYGWYNRNAAINPFQIEGKRTVGHELAEQTSDEIPDWVVFSMGDGCTIAGCWKGLREFAELGYVDDTPKLLGVQPEGASAIHDAFHGAEDHETVAETLADAVAVGRPRNTVKACRALAGSGGTAVTVTDEAILDAETLLGRTEGIYAEPSGAAPVAGIQAARAQGIIDPDESVVAVVTGFGLKDTQGAKQAVGDVTEVAPSLDDVAALYGTGDDGAAGGDGGSDGSSLTGRGA